MKLLKLIFVSAIAIIIFIMAYSTLPFIVWVFGGNFNSVTQDTSYIFLGGIFSLFMTGGALAEIFDKDLNLK